MIGEGWGCIFLVEYRGCSVYITSHSMLGTGLAKRSEFNPMFWLLHNVNLASLARRTGIACKQRSRTVKLPAPKWLGVKAKRLIMSTIRCGLKYGSA